MTPLPNDFEWDEAKAASNLDKHGLSFVEATAVFLDPDLIEISTLREQDGEARRKIIGRIDGRLFTVVFVLRRGRCRLISARRANRREERIHGDREVSH